MLGITSPLDGRLFQQPHMADTACHRKKLFWKENVRLKTQTFNYEGGTFNPRYII